MRLELFVDHLNDLQIGLTVETVPLSFVRIFDDRFVVDFYWV